MLYIFQELSILFLSTLTILFLLLITTHNKYNFFAIDTISFQNEFSHFTHQPVKFFYTLIHKNSYLFRLISYIFICSFCSSLFFFLTKNFSLILSAILVLPLSLFLIYIFYYIIYFFSTILIKIIDVGAFSLNSIFSLIYINLGLVYITYPFDTTFFIQTIAFILSCINLFICYILLLNTLRFILKNILSYTNIFNHHNLWKVALLIIFTFLSILTLCCYIGNIYYPNAYSVDTLTIFDLFYYVVITFGTIGYGDISPTCMYTKAIAILIVFTSIGCISIMLSSFLSVTHEKDE